MTRQSSVAALLCALALANCEASMESGRPDAMISIAQPNELNAMFESVAAEYDVPAELLMAIAWTETRWNMVYGDEEGHNHGQAPAYGVMALRGRRLSEGADLAGVSEEDARSDALSNIRAATAWLSARADELGVEPRSDVFAWSDVVAEYPDLADPSVQSMYVEHDVFGALRSGFIATAEDGHELGGVSPLKGDGRSNLVQPPTQNAAGPDYPSSIWRPSPNYSSRPSGVAGDPQMVIIHSCEGSYSGCWGWLANSASGVSAHYVVDSTGSEISQLVLESNKAWHIGADYDCNNNDGVSCNLNGYGSNGFTVGIEHAGFASQSSWDPGLLQASAALVCDITKAHGIPRDANHIVAHGQLQPYNRTDPGPNWPWDDYIDLVREACGDGGGGGGGSGFTEIIVDNYDANNDLSVGDAEYSSGWTGSSATPGYWETGYRFAETGPISDGFSFWFYLDEAGNHTVDAWWTQGTNRSPSAPYIAYNASGTRLGTVFANQQTGGSQWNALGTYNFTAGWNRVMLSRWTGSGYVVMADAIRVR